MRELNNNELNMYAKDITGGGIVTAGCLLMSSYMGATFLLGIGATFLAFDNVPELRERVFDKETVHVGSCVRLCPDQFAALTTAA